MAIYLVRHGSAGARDESDPADHLRELDEAGRSQAERLTGWLRHQPVTRVVSSPYTRCVQTVEPLASALGLSVECCEAFAETAPVERSWGALAELADECVVVCSHGDVIPDLVRRAQMRGMHVPGKSGFSKGSVWTLDHWDGERFATGTYTPIPRDL